MAESLHVDQGGDCYSIEKDGKDYTLEIHDDRNPIRIAPEDRQLMTLYRMVADALFRFPPEPKKPIPPICPTLKLTWVQPEEKPKDTLILD